MLDAEEVRGSNPLAPTKTAGRRPFSSTADLFLSAEERHSQYLQVQTRRPDAVRI
jgi:hypothetical protein